MKKIFICNSVYHLLIAICKSNKEDLLVIDTPICNNKELVSRLVNNNENFIFSHDFINNRKKFKDNEIYIFNDQTVIGRKLHLYKIGYHLIEDGYNYHQVIKTRVKEKNIIKKIKHKLIGFGEHLGYSQYCKSIEVNSLEKVNLDVRKEKFFEYPRKKLFSEITIESKKRIQKIFLQKELEFSNNPKVLILTQPLAKDIVVTFFEGGIQGQIQFYKDIIDTYKDSYDVYFKKHPRDDVDYGEIDAFEIPSDMPVEVVQIFYNVKFDIGITHSSSAMSFIDFIDQKIILVDLSKKINGE